MKKNIFIGVSLIFLNMVGFSQEFNPVQEDTSKHVFISAGVILTHFIPTDAATDLDWKTQVLSPGGEVLIGYKFNNNFSLTTGLNYQFGEISLSHFYYGDRTFFHEISVPLLFGLSFLINGKSKYFFYSGVNLAKFSHIKRETKGGKILSDSNKWYGLNNGNYLNFISDVYLSLSFDPYGFKLPISFDLFAKYRLNDYWLNDYINRFFYGIKVNYQLNL